MATRDTTQLAQPAGSAIALPSKFPDKPTRLCQAFPDFSFYHEESALLYKRIREAVRGSVDDLVLPLNAVQNSMEFLRTDLSTTVDGVVASLLIETEARALADGYVESSFTLTATAGNVITGMRLISATGVTPVSEVIFQADKFTIWNGTSAVPLFALTGSALTLAVPITLLSSQVTGLGSFATISSLAYGSLTGTKPPTNADVTLSAIQGTLSLAGGGLVLASAGACIRGGQTAWDTGSGFWIGDVSGVTKFSIGNSAGDSMTWDGSQLSIYGDLNAVSGTIGGFNIGSNGLSVGTGTEKIELKSLSGTYLRFGEGGATATTILTLGNLLFLDSSGVTRTSLSEAVISLLNSGGTAYVTMSGNTGAISSLGTISAAHFSTTGTISASGAISGTAEIKAGSFKVGDYQVVGARGLTVAAVSGTGVTSLDTGIAETYWGTASNDINRTNLSLYANEVDTQLNNVGGMVNSLKAAVNDLRARMQAHGLIA
jgi:hypothetical protein